MSGPPGVPGTPVVVFAHAYYPSIWNEMSVLLADRLDLPFHLVLTRTTPGDDPAMPDTRHLVGADVLTVENRGRDIRPFLWALAQVRGFDVGLKLHSKKSPQRLDGAHWRASLLDSLLPPGGTAALVAQLREEPRIGLVAPAEFCLSVAPWVLQNEPGMVSLAASLDWELTESDLDDAYFAAGSMFWFRRAAIEALAGDVILDLFEPELGQLDGTIAHAMERMFPVEAKRSGYVSLAVPALMASHPGSSIGELTALARQHADIPTRYFPGPGIPESPLVAVPAPSSSKPGVLRALLHRRGLPLGMR